MVPMTKLRNPVWPALIMMTLHACAGQRQREALPESGESILREVHARYAGKRFTQVTFVQTTRHGDGTVERWYEALAPVGRVRVDIAPLESRNGFMFRADSQYVFRDGRVEQQVGGQRWLSMLLLLDLYALPIDRVLARAAELGLRLDRAHAGTWQDRQVYVAGALPGDTVSPQVWYDREHLYPVRLIQRAWPNGTTYDWHLEKHTHVSGGWIEGEIRIFSEGRLLVTERYDSVVPREALPDSLFQPSPYRPPAWLRP